jgi:rhamnosyltransferase
VRTGAVVVSYYPDSDFSRRLRVAAEQVELLVVVDNTDDLQAKKDIYKICRTFGVLYKNLSTNVGIAKATNVGIQELLLHGCDCILFLDQDSSLLPGAVKQMELSLQRARDNGISVGMVCPETHDEYLGSPKFESEKEDCEVQFAISSGALVLADVIREIGLFVEEYFIDCVDQEYCLRVRRSGKRIIRSSSAHMLHRLGNPSKHYMCGLSFITTNHIAIRRYYIARNTVWMTKAYWPFDCVNLGIINFKLFKNIVLCLIFESQRIAKLYSYSKGLAIGLVTPAASWENESHCMKDL